MRLSKIFPNVLVMLTAGAFLLVGIWLLGKGIKLVWKFVRVGLVVMVVLLIAGYFLGFVQINLW
jgi:hypothetical protein